MHFALIVLQISCKLTLPSFYINEYMYFGSYFSILKRINLNINKIIDTTNIIDVLEQTKLKECKDAFEETLNKSKFLIKSRLFDDKEILKHFEQINNPRQKIIFNYYDTVKTILIILNLLGSSSHINLLIPEIRVLFLYTISIFDNHKNIDQLLYLFFILIKYAESAMLIKNDELQLDLRNKLEIGISSLLKLIYYFLKKDVLGTEDFKKINLTHSDRFNLDTENRLLKIHKTCITLLYIENMKSCSKIKNNNHKFEILASYGSFWKSNVDILHEYYDIMYNYIFRDFYQLGISILGY